MYWHRIAYSMLMMPLRIYSLTSLVCPLHHCATVRYKIDLFVCDKVNQRCAMNGGRVDCCWCCCFVCCRSCQCRLQVRCGCRQFNYHHHHRHHRWKLRESVATCHSGPLVPPTRDQAPPTRTPVNDRSYSSMPGSLPSLDTFTNSETSITVLVYLMT